MMRGRANWTRAALVAVGLFSAACGGDAVPEPVATGPVAGAPMVQLPTAAPAAADAADPAPATDATPAPTPAAPDDVTASGADSAPAPVAAPTSPEPVPATPSATPVVPAPTPAGTATTDPPPADDVPAETPDTAPAAPVAPVAPPPTPDVATVGDLDTPRVPAPEPAAPPAAASAQPAPAKDGGPGATADGAKPAAEADPWPKTKKGEALLVSFDDLASFVWLDPGAAAAPAAPAGGDLGPPDPDADASAGGRDDLAVPAPSPEHTGPSGETTSEVPKKIKLLGGRSVSVEGYMIPLEFDEDGAVRKFLLSRYMQGCCFGMLPQANELVLVKMVNPEGTAYEPYLTVLATGTFRVHDKGTALGALKTLYEIDATTCKFVIDR